MIDEVHVCSGVVFGLTYVNIDKAENVILGALVIAYTALKIYLKYKYKNK